MSDYKNTFVEGIVNSFLFEDAYDVQNPKQFDLTNGDVVQIDLRPRIQQLSSELNKLKSVPLEKLTQTDDGKVVVKDEPAAQPTQSATAASTTPPKKETAKEIVSDVKGDLAKKEILDFIKMLKDNGSLSTLSIIDDKTRQAIAKAIAKMVQKKSISESDFTLCNEAHEKLTGKGIVCELDVSGTKPAPVAAPAASAPVSAAPEAKPSPTVAELIKNIPAELKDDPRLQYVLNLQKELDSYKNQNIDIDRDFMGTVTSVDKNKVHVKTLIPDSRKPDGSIRYKTGTDMVVPFTSIRRRAPAEKAQSLLGKIGNWFKN